MSETKVSIIIPAYNEAQTIGELVEKIQNLFYGFEIIVINDGSSDATAEAARDAGAIVYSHPYNIGNGAAIKSGIRIASGDILVFMDADGQHDPKEIEKLLEYFSDYDMVVGARGTDHQASWGRALANKIYNRFASYVAKFSIEDLTSGFRAIKSEIARNFLYLLPNTYSYPTTLTLCTLRNGRSVKYVPLNARKRKAGKSKIKIFRDGIRFFLIITKICTLYSPLRVFLPVSLLTFLLGLSYYAYTFLTLRRFTNMSALLFTTSILIFMMGLI
jgi:glycosyltransferase involved in cell wall biosynthesis